MTQQGQSNSWQEGIAFIIETREHTNLPMVIENIDRCLPKGWEIWFFHSKDNDQYIDDNCIKQFSRNYKKILLEKPIQSLNDYNELLLNKSFWHNFSQENILCFQVDTLINIKQKKLLKEICDYHYVGAPWSDGILRRWSDLPTLGGNGGFCFSKRSQRIKALSECSFSTKQKDHPSIYINEDIWFSKAFVDIKAKLPSRETAQTLLVESSFSKKPFAVHKPWSYVSPTELTQLYQEIPQLTELHMGCVAPVNMIPCSPKPEECIYNDSTRKALLNYARDHIHSDNFYFADKALQISHSYFPDDAKTLNLQAMLGYSIGAHDQALNFAELALKRQPHFKKAQDNYKLIKKHAAHTKASQTSTEERFLLLHSLGKGFAYDLLNLAAHQLLAEVLNRKLVIYWGNNSCVDSHANENIYTTLFKDPDNTRLKDIVSYQADVFPHHWKTTPLHEFKRRTSWLDKTNGQRYCISNIAFFNKTEKLVISTELADIPLLKTWLPLNHDYKKLSVEEVFQRTLKTVFKPKKVYIDKANDLIKQSFQEQDYIAFHLRAYDTDTGKKGAFPTNSNDQILSFVDQHPKNTPLFLITDDHEILAAMKKKYGSRLFTFGGVLFKDSIQGYDNKTSLKNTQKSLVEMLVVQTAKYFYGSEYSYFDCCIDFLRPKTQSFKQTNSMLNYLNPPIIEQENITSCGND
ncbi:MAG: DUF5672 family protein [Arenicella sp.]